MKTLLLVALTLASQCTGPACRARGAAVISSYTAADGRTVQWSASPVAGWTAGPGYYWTISPPATVPIPATPRADPVAPTPPPKPRPPDPPPATEPKATASGYDNGVDMEDVKAQAAPVVSNAPEMARFIDPAAPSQGGLLNPAINNDVNLNADLVKPALILGAVVLLVAFVGLAGLVLIVLILKRAAT